MVNGFVFLISLSDFSLLLYRNERDFCLLVFYPATLLNSLISSRNFLVISLGFSMYKIICKQWGFTSFPNWIPFISFSSLIAMARTSKSMLNNSGGYGHFVLFLISEEMLSVFTTENNFCCEFAVYGLYYVEVGSFCVHFLERFWVFFLIS